MKNLIFIFLATVLTSQVEASLVSLENAKSHFRINLRGDRGQINVTREGDRVILKSLNKDVIDQTFRTLKNSKLDKRFIKQVEKKVDRRRNVSFLDITLAEPEVEFFSFFRDRERRYVVDFWKENIQPNKESLPDVKEVKEIIPPAKPKVLKAEALKKKPVRKKQLKKQKKVRKDKVVIRQAKPVDSAKLLKKSPLYRDFRYGAAFMWDYEPVAPDFKPVMMLNRKTANISFQ